MFPVKTNHTNTNFTKEGCQDLPGTTYRYEDGSTGIETCWELTPEDLEKLLKMEHPCIFVYMQGVTVPPMLLSTECLIQFNDTEEADNENTEKA